ncbi:MAG: CvpA family protein [Gammaproteobacteria bacterium]|nr:CvpA family protein [Gammaproteobacteria bacterium]
MIDFIVIAVLLVSLLIGLFRGFVSEVLSLASWTVSLWAAYAHARGGADYFAPYIAQSSLRLVAAFIAIFLLTLIVVSFIGHVIRRFVLFGGVGGIDRTLGMLFGLTRGVVIVGLFVLVSSLMGLNAEVWWQQSHLLGYFEPAARGLVALLPPEWTAYFSVNGGV